VFNTIWRNAPRFALFSFFALGTLSAATIDTNTLVFDFTTGTFNGTFSQFDPSLGTLTGLDFGLNDTFSHFTANVSNSGSGPVSMSADFTFGGDVTLPGFFFANWVFNTVPGLSCSGTDSCSASSPQFTVGSGVNPISPSPDLSAYVGLGTVDFALAIDQSITNQTSSPSGGSATLTGLELNGSTFLRYEYTPSTATTPEPSSMVLMGGGLGALLFARRKLRASR
jgi:hypothetical protein